jgi:tetratricopeptide (TPR) repeat protein
MIRKWRTVLVLAGVACLIVVGGMLFRQLRSQPRLVRELQAAFRRGEYLRCCKIADELLARDPGATETLVLAGRAAARLNDFERALQYFRAVPAAATPMALEAKTTAGELAYNLGLAREAEVQLRAALEIDPHHGPANGLLAYLLILEGRSWEALPALLEPVRRNEYPVEHLLLLGASEPLIANVEQMERFRKAVPDDLVPLIGEARQNLRENREDDAEPLLRRIVAAAPASVEARVRLGEALAKAKPDEFPKWHRALARDVDRHPQIWVARGIWAESADLPEAAVRCYWEAVRRDSEHRVANQRLAMQLRAIGKERQALPFLERAAKLELLERTVDNLRRSAPLAARPEILAAMRQASQLTEQLGRIWEARAWADQGLRLDPQAKWAQTARERLARLLDDPWLPQTLESARPAQLINLADFPLPQSTFASAGAIAKPGDAADVPPISFRDDAASAGIDFTYQNGAVSDDDEVRLVETTGGGVAVLDFDGDNWPDLYFTQGGAWPPAAPANPDLPDRLFRNSGDGRFLDVTADSGLGDLDYSQGVTVGDFDDDGFPDLYVANIGVNRLYRNNGDGSFRDVSARLPPQKERWTTSCLLADVNGDSWPDLYDVTYVANVDLGRSVCSRGNELVGCSPGLFRAGHDRLCLSTGDGGFRDVSDEAGILVANGMGLGIVAADIAGSGRIDLVVANDAYPNFHFRNTVESPGGVPRFVEQGVLSGLAFDGNGHAQASMGIAAGDANQDGLLDLFVTNFLHEGSTLYVQGPGGQFLDETARFGLREPSLSTLGFGTQFLDADRDGLPDLVVANGHVYDMSERGEPYRMGPQFYRNLGHGRFREQSPGGAFFQRPQLGRGLARIDWNRDGREDFAISHLDTTAALVTNTTAAAGHFLAVHLRGRFGSRDAIGTIVSLEAGDRVLVRQLTAGDGYQASNQRILLFGLGPHHEPVRVHLHWPGGREVEYPSVAVDREVLFVEGSSAPVELRAASR